jgi:hypothetical protein
MDRVPLSDSGNRTRRIKIVKMMMERPALPISSAIDPKPLTRGATRKVFQSSVLSKTRDLQG